MNSDWLEIHEYEGEGYQPLIDFNDWRVAILRYLPELQPDRIASMERHLETDEVFVLLEGRGVLLMGGKGEGVEGVLPQKMEPGKAYNIKQGAWHSILLTQDATVLLVENKDTSEHNSEFIDLTPEQQGEVQAIAAREGFA